MNDKHINRHSLLSFNIYSIGGRMMFAFEIWDLSPLSCKLVASTLGQSRWICFAAMLWPSSCWLSGKFTLLSSSSITSGMQNYVKWLYEVLILYLLKLFQSTFSSYIQVPRVVTFFPIAGAGWKYTPRKASLPMQGDFSSEVKVPSSSRIVCISRYPTLIKSWIHLSVIFFKKFHCLV